jgi:FK506-binding nuclear protein
MAAIDPSAAPRLELHPDGAAPRATLKIIKERAGPDLGLEDDSDDEDYDDVDAIRARLADAISEEEDEDSGESDSDEEKNGGPSDPARTKAVLKQALAQDMDMSDDDLTNGMTNGTKSNKGKGKALDIADLVDVEGDSDEDSEGDEIEEFVLCTLDPEKVP